MIGTTMRSRLRARSNTYTVSRACRSTFASDAGSAKAAARSAETTEIVRFGPDSRRMST
jgi:hypothetical protein